MRAQTDPGSSRQVVEEFFARMNRHDAEGVVELFTDDGTYWIAGTLPLSGSHTRDGLGRILCWLFSAAPDFAFTVHGTVSEGDKVAVEAESRGTTGAGVLYHNRYHFLFEVEDGALRSGKEYLDTLHTAEVFLGATARPVKEG